MTMRYRTALLLVLLTGCAYAMPTKYGRPIDPEFVKSIEKGKTTTEDVQKALGKPMSTTESSGNKQQWTYMAWRGKPAMIGQSYSKSETQTLTISFENNTVSEYSFSKSNQ